MPFENDALLILGHGSTLNADSSAPTYQHADEIRRCNVFGEVHVGFWKEEPNFRQALRQTNRARVYVVPNFISSGYFTEEIIPREIGLAGRLTRMGDQEVIYCDPVGLHPSMTNALLQRAREVVIQSHEVMDRPEKTACLFICGHGTSFNDNSTKIIHEQVGAIQRLGGYADCQAVLMEQAPFIKDWRTLTSLPDVIVVPFFISDGLHSFEDIPVLLGLTHKLRERSFANPHREAGRRLWYAGAIGTDTAIADVILAQAARAELGHPENSNHVSSSNEIEKGQIRFLADAPPPWKMGQVIISENFELRHEKDREIAASALRPLTGLEDLRELIRLDEEGAFRPLRAAPNLRRGWLFRVGDAVELQAALDYIYPAELANWQLWRASLLPITPWPETAERQTGRFRVVRELTADGVKELVATYCERGCLKTRLWSPANEPIQVVKNEVPLVCPEACNFLVGKAREKLKGTAEE